MYNSTPVKRQHHRPPPGQSSAIAIEHLHHWHAKHIYICQHFGLHIISKGHLWRKGEDADLIVKVGVLEVCGKSAEKLWENMNLTALSEKRTSLHNACYICLFYQNF